VSSYLVCEDLPLLVYVACDLFVSRELRTSTSIEEVQGTPAGWLAIFSAAEEGDHVPVCGVFLGSEERLS
jgi:hypothetical protein